MKKGLSMSRRRSLQASVKATTVEMSERAAISSRRSDGSVHPVDAGGAPACKCFLAGSTTPPSQVNRREGGRWIPLRMQAVVRCGCGGFG
jgi:hypothetical protein